MSRLRLLSLIIVLSLTNVGLAAEPASSKSKAGAKAKQFAFLFGESIPKKDAPPSFGIIASHIEWWVGDPHTSQMRRLVDAQTGKMLVSVRPVDQTIILKQDESAITLLGPTGGQLTLSKKSGPLARAGIDSGQADITTFAYTPDGKHLVYANAKNTICRIDLKSKELLISKIKNVNRAKGVRYSPDGSRIVYGKYYRKDNYSPGMHQVYIANADFSGEKKLTEYPDGKQIGFSFLPDGRVGVVGPNTVRAFDPKSGTKAAVIKQWEQPLKFRAFGGFHPDGSSFNFDVGGPYMLRLFAFDTNSKKLTTLRKSYLESFQSMIWVQVSPKR